MFGNAHDRRNTKLEPAYSAGGSDPGISRMIQLGELGAEARAALQWAARRCIEYVSRREFLAEAQTIEEPYLVLDGWAARLRILADGRRQLLGFYLPGDIIGDPLSSVPGRASTTLALTSVRLCRLPPVSPALEVAYARSLACLTDYMLAQIARLGRMTAYERIADLLLELLGRLDSCGLVRNNSFALPLTQEMLADVLGLTPVHINRTVQQLRHADAVRWSGKQLALVDPQALGKSIGA
jgi:CRP-like cAMP-binding protein